MTMTSEVDFGWYGELDGRRSRLTWALDLGGGVYLFRATGESEILAVGVPEADARAFGDWCMGADERGEPARDADEVRARAEARWPS